MGTLGQVVGLLGELAAQVPPCVPETRVSSWLALPLWGAGGGGLGRWLTRPSCPACSYPYSEDSNQGQHYMNTRCPAWCDRVLMSPSAKELVLRVSAGVTQHLAPPHRDLGCQGQVGPQGGNMPSVEPRVTLTSHVIGSQSLQSQCSGLAAGAGARFPCAVIPDSRLMGMVTSLGLKTLQFNVSLGIKCTPVHRRAREP